MRSPIALVLRPMNKSRQLRWRRTAILRRVTVDELFDAWERAWSGRDPRGFDSLCADGFQYEDPLTTEPLRGPGGVAAHAKRLWEAFPDARVNSTGNRLSDGAYACAPCKVLGTQTGEIDGIGVTGRAIVVHALVYA